MKILNPAGVPRSSAEQAFPALASLAGRRLAVLTNRWKSMDRIAARVEARIQERHGAAGVKVFAIPINGAMPESVERGVLQECDAAIVGLAN
jgi:hypothetical protein